MRIFLVLGVVEGYKWCVANGCAGIRAARFGVSVFNGKLWKRTDGSSHYGRSADGGKSKLKNNDTDMET